jgi:group II intron reverse transcriptase/maturase
MKPKGKFNSLAHLLTLDFLKGCFRELKRNKASGIDGVSVKEYDTNLEENLKDLVSRLKEKKYRPQPVRRTYIPKSGGGKRGLGVPTVEDKIVQMGIKKILESIFEVDFLDVSYGFRPNRSCHDALADLNETIMLKSVNYVVDMDIEKFFDTIDHKWLMKFLKERITDTSLLRLISRFLKAGIMEDGKFIETDKGTPQGGVLSPILANIYLHFVLDLWFEKRVKKELKGYSHLVRYADDFIVCLQFSSSAQLFGVKLKDRLVKFGLKLSEKKSKIIHFGRYAWYKAQREGHKVATFDFLGFTHYCTKSRKGTFKLGRKTSSARFRQKLKEINLWLKRVRSLVKLQDWWRILCLKLNGHYRYYGISGNSREMQKFHYRVIKLAYKWINKRSQKKSYTYDRFLRYVKHNPLPKPRIYHGAYLQPS